MENQRPKKKTFHKSSFTKQPSEKKFSSNKSEEKSYNTRREAKPWASKKPREKPWGNNAGKDSKDSRDSDEPSSLIVGINAVVSLLEESPNKVHRVAMAHGTNNPRLHELQKLAKQARILVHQLPLTKLDQWYRGKHQGVVAFCHARELDNWIDVKEKLAVKIRENKNPIILLPAGIEDPRNLGACIRSAVGFGAEVVLIPNKKSTGVTPTAAKASAGATEKISICQLSNLEQELEELEAMGFRIVALEGSAEQSLHQDTYRHPLVLVVGGEDQGVPAHLKRKCHSIVRIPMNPRAHSFNASVALSILLYEVHRQRNFEDFG